MPILLAHHEWSFPLWALIASGGAGAAVHAGWVWAKTRFFGHEHSHDDGTTHSHPHEHSHEDHEH